jgi:hypothetical protein
LNGFFKFVQSVFEVIDLQQDLVAVGGQDVAPHHRISLQQCARKSLKPGPPSASQFGTVVLLKNAANDGVRQHVREVAHSSKSSIVFSGCEFGDVAAQALPDLLGQLQLVFAPELAMGVTISARSLYRSASECSTPATSLPAMGWTGTKHGSLSPKVWLSAASHDVCFGRANIHQECIRFQGWRNCLEAVCCGLHRNCQQNQIGARYCLPQCFRQPESITPMLSAFWRDDSKRRCNPQCEVPSRQPSCCQRKRAAHQTAANESDFFEFHSGMG